MTSNGSNSQSSLCLLPGMSSLADTRSHGLLLNRLPHPGADDSGADGAILDHCLSSVCCHLLSSARCILVSIISLYVLVFWVFHLHPLHKLLSTQDLASWIPFVHGLPPPFAYPMPSTSYCFHSQSCRREDGVALWRFWVRLSSLTYLSPPETQ